MSDRFEPTVDLSTPPSAVRWDLGEKAPVRRAAEKVCGLRLGERLFAVPAGFVRGLRQIENITDVPRTPPHVLGVTHLQGAILPVVDLGPMLGIRAPRPGPPWSCLWMHSDPWTVLLAVDEVVAFEPRTSVDGNVDQDDENLSTELGPAACGETRILGQPVPLLDIPRLLDQARPGAPESAE